MVRLGRLTFHGCSLETATKGVDISDDKARLQQQLYLSVLEPDDIAILSGISFVHYHRTRRCLWRYARVDRACSRRMRTASHNAETGRQSRLSNCETDYDEVVFFVYIRTVQI
jgi:hypothetical protein